MIPSETMSGIYTAERAWCCAPGTRNPEAAHGSPGPPACNALRFPTWLKYGNYMHGEEPKPHSTATPNISWAV